jgi:hypothetical protein
MNREPINSLGGLERQLQGVLNLIGDIDHYVRIAIEEVARKNGAPDEFIREILSLNDANTGLLDSRALESLENNYSGSSEEVIRCVELLATCQREAEMAEFHKDRFRRFGHVCIKGFQFPQFPRLF